MKNNKEVCFPIEYMDWQTLISHRNQLVGLAASADSCYLDALNTAIAVIEQLLTYQNYEVEKGDNLE